MSRFFVFPDSPEGWKEGLASPTQWRPGRSAHSLAYAWHPHDGFPPGVAQVFAASELGPLEFIAGIPEYKVALPGGNAASQTDLFVLARTTQAETVALAVEGKAREEFGDQTVADWRLGASPGKNKRLKYLLQLLGLPDDEKLGPLRYQLLHRTASPIIEAERLHARCAVMLVHSFKEPDAEPKWLREYAEFAELLGASGRENEVSRASNVQFPLYLGWVTDDHPEVVG